MQLVIRLTGAWLTVWQRYSERRELRRQQSAFAIRRWVCRQPVIHPQTGRGVVVSMSSRLRTTPYGASENGNDAA